MNPFIVLQILDGTPFNMTGPVTSVLDLPAENPDIIIVGGGTAGLVVANRLSEDPALQILVIEAGADHHDDPRITTPGLAVSLLDDPKFDWQFLSEPQVSHPSYYICWLDLHSLSEIFGLVRLIFNVSLIVFLLQPHLNGRRVALPQGKVLGGSSAINLLVNVYPSKSGIDAWGKLGNPGWEWDTLAPYYRKYQTFHPPSQHTSDLLALGHMDKDLQGTTGPIQTSFAEENLPLTEAWPQTFRNLNFAMTGDPLSGEANGGFSNPSTLDPRTKTRSYTGNAYYSPEISKRPNLHVLTEALVEKVIFDRHDTVEADNVSISAIAVRVTDKNGKSHIVRANKEIILSAGSLQTPKILQLSGVGDRHLLESHGIDLVIDNEYVGKNLQDHPYASLCFEVADGVQTGDIMRDPKVAEALMAQYQTSRSGSFAAGAASSQAYMPVVNFLDTNGRSELTQLLEEFLDKDLDKNETPAKKQQFDLLRAILQSPDDASIQYLMAPLQNNSSAGPDIKAMYSLERPGNYMTILTCLSHPFSRGNVQINSSDPKEKPVFNPNYLSHPIDLEILARHMQYLEVLTRTQPLASMLKANGKRIPEGRFVSDLNSAKEHAIEAVVSNYHPSGSCAMMPKELGGVVSERLVVHGTRNLRIVDASIFPLSPRGNIQSSVYAVAERAADLIKQDLSKQAKIA